MCGFAAMVGLNGAKADPQVVRRMRATLEHRGPDGEGLYVDGSVGIGFRRLSIIDLTDAGNQPMVSRDGRLVLVFNGEIYNYLELRSELRSFAHEFRSQCDSEVLLYAYEQWGPQCLEKLNGMWAFLVYDSVERKLFGSRDRFGQKPLYKYEHAEYVFFASEIKAILASGHYTGGMNGRKMSRFLSTCALEQMGEDNHTFYAGIEQVPAGTAFELHLNGKLEQRRFWSLDELPGGPTASPDPASTFRELFEDSVRLRMRSDVRLGIFLSGGIDSTSIACALAVLRQQEVDGAEDPVLAFSFESEEHDESAYIGETVGRTGVRLLTFRPDPLKLFDELERFLWYQDEPVHSMAALITYELSRLAAEHGVKVILNGGGSDEYLAGYTTFFTDYWRCLLRNRRLSHAWDEISRFAEIQGGSRAGLYRAALKDVMKHGLRRFGVYRRLAARRRFREQLGDTWVTQDLLENERSRQPECENPLDFASLLKGSVGSAPLPLYLRIEDRNSMAQSVEARMPFLDYRLVSLAFLLGPEWKIQGPWSKVLLREAMRGMIPELVRNRVDKMGFPVPARSWFATVLYEPVRDLLESRVIRESGLFQVDRIRRDVELHRDGAKDVSSKMFSLLQFAAWTKNLRKADPVTESPARVALCLAGIWLSAALCLFGKEMALC